MLSIFRSEALFGHPVLRMYVPAQQTRKMNEKFPLNVNSNCTINVRASLRLPGPAPTRPGCGWAAEPFCGSFDEFLHENYHQTMSVGVRGGEAGQKWSSPNINNTITVSNQREFFVHFTGLLC